MNEFYTTGEAAAILNVTNKTLQNWDREGKFHPEQRQGNKRLYSRSQIENKLGKTIEETVNPILNLKGKTVFDLFAKDQLVMIDFGKLLGETIKEKYESIYLYMSKATHDMKRNTGVSCANFVLASPEITAWFEPACDRLSLNVERYDTSLDFVGDINSVKYVGVMNNKWKLYISNSFDADMMCMGIRDGSKIIDVPGSKIAFKLSNYLY